MTTDPLNGWITHATKWRAPIQPPTPPVHKHFIDGADWPQVEWPTFPKSPGLSPRWTGEGDWGQFIMGVGGAACADYEPAAGYWCLDPPRGIATPAHASGVYATHELLPNAFDEHGKFAYNDTRHAVVHAWRPAHWYMNMWEVGAAVTQPHTLAGNSEQSLVSSSSAAGSSTANTTVTPPAGVLLPFTRGGFQGAEGTSEGAEWYIENVLEELDATTEWYYDEDIQTLYFLPNSTQQAADASDSSRAADAPIGDISSSGGGGGSSFVATKLKVLINITGSKETPAHHLAIRGLTLRDTAYTYMDAHGLPSGGDWALQHSGAVTLAGTENIEIQHCNFTRLDGLGVFLAGYNRNTSISGSEFSWIGDSAMAAWGETSAALNANGSKVIEGGIRFGPDGRAGDQPRDTQIVGNLIREIG